MFHKPIVLALIAPAAIVFAQTSDEAKFVRDSVIKADKIIKDDGLFGLQAASRTLFDSASKGPNRRLMLQFLAYAAFGTMLDVQMVKMTGCVPSKYFNADNLTPNLIKLFEVNRLSSEEEAASLYHFVAEEVRNQMKIIAVD